MEEMKLEKTADQKLAERIVQGGIPEALKVVSELQSAIGDQQKIAETGYAQAYQVIAELRQRLENQKAEYEKQLETGYEEAYQMLLGERKKNEELEVTLYEEYEIKLREMKNHIVDKVDQFLNLQGQKFAKHPQGEEAGYKEFRSTHTAERVVVDALNERFSPASDDEMPPVREKEQMRILEAKLMRLQVENRKLNERVAKLEAAAPKPIMDDVFKGGLLGGIGHYTKEQLEEGAKYYGTIRLGGGNDTPDERDTTHDL